MLVHVRFCRRESCGVQVWEPFETDLGHRVYPVAGIGTPLELSKAARSSQMRHALGGRLMSHRPVSQGCLPLDEGSVTTILPGMQMLADSSTLMKTHNRHSINTIIRDCLSKKDFFINAFRRIPILVTEDNSTAGSPVPSIAIVPIVPESISYTMA